MSEWLGGDRAGQDRTGQSKIIPLGGGGSTSASWDFPSPTAGTGTGTVEAFLPCLQYETETFQPLDYLVLLISLLWLNLFFDSRIGLDTSTLRSLPLYLVLGTVQFMIEFDETGRDDAPLGERSLFICHCVGDSIIFSLSHWASLIM